jgi:hypothetical protein
VRRIAGGLSRKSWLSGGATGIFLLSKPLAKADATDVWRQKYT